MALSRCDLLLICSLYLCALQPAQTWNRGCVSWHIRQIEEALDGLVLVQVMSPFLSLLP